MISEAQQDLALAYLLGEMDAREASHFESALATDAALRQFVDEMRESAAALALALPARPPPPGLRARILAGVQATARPTRSASQPRSWRWLTPALGGLAACLVLVLLAFLHQNRTLRQHADQLAQQLTDLTRQFDTLQSTSAAQRQQIAEWQARNSLAEVKIATLSAQAEAYRRASVVVVWDERTQQGVVKLVDLPKAAAGQDYQLWIIDSKVPGGPVSAGVLAVGEGTATLDSFKGVAPASPNGGFAITIEKAGGVPKAEGAIVFVGN